MSTAYVTACIEFTDGRVVYRTYRDDDRTIRQLKARIVAYWRKDPTVEHVGCGNGYYQNSYGAH